MTYKNSICSKHDFAIKSLKRLERTYSVVVDSEDFSSLIFEILDYMEDAKTDGMKMESGLDKKRDRIVELEKENEIYIDKISYLESEIEQLESKNHNLEIQQYYNEKTI